MSGIRTNDGGYALVGTNGNIGAIVKTDASGTVQWTQTYSNSPTPGFGNSDCLNDIIQTTDGSYVVTGMTMQNMFVIVNLSVAKFVVPEYAFGSLALSAAFAGLAIFKVYKRQVKNPIRPILN
jgi:hypothetical protein